MRKRFFIPIIFPCGCLLVLLALGCGGEVHSPATDPISASKPPEPIERYGLMWEEYDLDSGVVASGQSLSHILSPAGMSAGQIALLANATKKDYDVRKMQSGKP